MSFRPTEYTVRELLIEELKKRGVKVTPEISFVSPVGRLVPRFAVTEWRKLCG